jgi:hypothetical protein
MRTTRPLAGIVRTPALTCLSGNPMLDAQHLLWTQIAAGVCLLIFAGLLFNLFRLRSEMRAAEGWRKTEGVITVSRVDQPPSHASDDLNDASPIIRYRYHAGGQDLESDRIMPGGQPLTTRVLALRQVARYPVGARVDVYVDPDDSGNVLLEPGTKNNLVALIAFAIVFGVLAVILTAHAVAGKVLYTGNGVPLFAFALPALAILAAVVSFASFIRALRLARASARWPTAAGTVTTADVIEEEIEETNNERTVIRIIHRYQVDLRYAYQVGKRDFVGTRRIWDGPASTAFAKSRKKPPGDMRRASRSPSITIQRSPVTPCSNPATAKARWRRCSSACSPAASARRCWPSSSMSASIKINPPDQIRRGITTSRLGYSPEKGKYHFKEVLTVLN